MTQHSADVLERIRQGLVYTESEAAFLSPSRHGQLVFEYNHTPPDQAERRRALLAAALGSVGARTVLNAPFHAAYGSNVHLGDDFYGNVNLTFVDDVEIRIGDGVMIAPGVTLTTTSHPVHPDRRADFGRYCEPITIEGLIRTLPVELCEAARLHGATPGSASGLVVVRTEHLPGRAALFPAIPTDRPEDRYRRCSKRGIVQLY